MRRFVLTTKSESGDDYMYFIENESVPTPKDISRFLKTNANDREDGIVYEQMQQLREIYDTNFLKL